jgi:large subunit ribosomal protein L35
MGKRKQKTHKASKKRFKVSAKGKLMHNRQNDNAHLKTKKSNKTLRRQEGTTKLGSRTEAKKIKKLLNT